MSRNKDVVTGLVTVGLAIFLFASSRHVKDFAATGVGASFLPQVAATLLAVLGVFLIVEGWRYNNNDRASVHPTSRPTDSLVNKVNKVDEGRIFGGWPAVLLSVVLMSAYIGTIDSLGFIPATAIYIFCQIPILAKGLRWRYGLFGVIAILTSALTFFLFVHVFQVMLPAGLLG